VKIGIIGLPQVGKKTIFRLLTGIDLSEAEPEKLKTAVHGMVTVRDPRFDRIVGLYVPKKKTPASIEAVLMPKIDKDSVRSGRLFEHLDDADAICHIVRAFTDEAVYHIEGSVDPVRDIEAVNTELILADLLFVEKRLQKLEKETKKRHEKKEEEERALLLGFKEHLEKELALRLLQVTDEQKKIISSYPFLTLKPLLLVINVGEDDLKKSILSKEILRKYVSSGIYSIQISAKIEDELTRLDSEKEREEFLRELGVEECAIDRLTRLLYETLGLISFFTTAHSEVRQWTIPRGSTAPQAAGAVHTDMERGFIRAEVVKYDDLVALGSESKVKEAGKFLVRGKDYVVCDGDIINFRFNV